MRAGRFGPYVQLGDPEEVKTRPRTASLLQGMDPERVTLEEALRLLTLPRVVGVDPSDGEEIVAQNGRYGPYLTKGRDSRSLASEEQLFSVTLDEALALFAQPRTRRGRGSAEPIRQLGDDPATGRQVVVREGRFGPYVTDGETNASLRKGDTIDAITLDRAAELLADRRAAGPPAKRGRASRSTATPAGFRKVASKKTAARKAAPKQGAAKKTVAKKTTTKKTTAKKTAAKKVAAKKAPAKKAAARQVTSGRAPE
jgi:DNA topoisomerase-1